MDSYLISRIPAEAVEAFTTHTEALGSDFLGPQYTMTVRAVLRNGPLSTVIALARNKYNPMPELFFEDEALLYVFSGYVVDDITRTRTPRHYFGHAWRDDRPILRSPGGIYSYVTVRRADGQLCAGHSTPSLEPVYYSGASESLHVGNNPLLVHIAARSFERPELNELFCLSAVNAGVAIDDSTPYLGCYRAPPRTMIVGNPASGMRLRPAPRPAYGRHRTATYRQRRDAVVSALVEAGSVLRRLPVGEFRVSGGKDSRLVAAYLKHAGISAVPVNQNFPQEVEGQVADMVARELGAPACERSPIEDAVDRNDLQGGTRRKVAFAGGLPAVASLQYPVRSEGREPGVPLIMGHAHLQRGGFPGRIRSTREAMEVATSRTVNPFLRSSFKESNLQQVRRFVFDVLHRHQVPQTVSFFAYLEYPMSYQFQSLYAYVRNWNPLITPLVDERFASVCEEIAISRSPRLRRSEHAGITDLHNEWIAMGATEKLGPSLLGFPLAHARYRCDGSERQGFELRDPDLLKRKETPPEDLRRAFNMRRMDAGTRGTLWEHLRGGVVASFAATACREEIWRYVSEPGSTVPEGVNEVAVNQLVWSLYGLSIILDSRWWEELVT